MARNEIIVGLDDSPSGVAPCDELRTMRSSPARVCAQYTSSTDRTG